MVTTWTGSAAAKTDCVGDIGGLLDYGNSIGLKITKTATRDQAHLLKLFLP